MLIPVGDEVCGCTMYMVQYMVSGTLPSKMRNRATLQNLCNQRKNYTYHRNSCRGERLN